MIMYEVVEIFTGALSELTSDSPYDPEYVAILVELPGNEYPELIVNRVMDAKNKMEYYKKTYNLDGTHKHVPGIRIVAVFEGTTLEKIENQLIRWEQEREDAETEKETD